MNLSYRLETIASFVAKGSKIADIGTDHGYIPIYLIQQGIAISAIAMDIKMGPLKRAQNHLRTYRLEDIIMTRLSDGLAQLQPGEADTVIIAGLGGELLIHILQQGKRLWQEIQTWILSPQSEIAKVRYYLAQNGFLISDETMITEEGKYYTVMRVVRGDMTDQKDQYYQYGKELIIKKDPVLRQFLAKESNAIQKILNQISESQSDTVAERKRQLVNQLIMIEEVIDEMQRDN